MGSVHLPPEKMLSVARRHLVNIIAFEGKLVRFHLGPRRVGREGLWERPRHTPGRVACQACPPHSLTQKGGHARLPDLQLEQEGPAPPAGRAARDRGGKGQARPRVRGGPASARLPASRDTAFPLGASTGGKSRYHCSSAHRPCGEQPPRDRATPPTSTETVSCLGHPQGQESSLKKAQVLASRPQA